MGGFGLACFLSWNHYEPSVCIYDIRLNEVMSLLEEFIEREWLSGALNHYYFGMVRTWR
jgi:hypothetical protein